MRLSPDVCPMCGSAGAGQVDHYLPQADYAEFSIFSRNLVPACPNCNNGRRTAVKGASHPARAMHPYYDQFLEDTLFKAVFEGDYAEPSITIELVDDQHPQKEILLFHKENVLQKNNQLEGWLDASWGKFVETPRKVIDVYLDGKKAKKKNITKALKRFEHSKSEVEFGTPNNWWSILLIGILEDDQLLKWLVKNYRNSTY